MINRTVVRFARASGPRAQRGVALITALLVVAIATIAVVSLASRQNLDIRRTGNVIESDQAYLYALGVEAVAHKLLSEYRSKFKYDDPSVMNVPLTYPVEGGIVSGSHIDLQGRYNVNRLAVAQGVSGGPEFKVFSRLLKTVLAALDEPGDPDELANAVVDWIDSNEQALTPGGAEDSAYLTDKQPYRTANRLMASPTELLLVRGFTKTLLYGKKVGKDVVPGLLKYVSVLPDSGAVLNANTAAPEVLLALSGHWTDAMVKDFIKDRAKTPYQKPDDFKDSPVVKAVVDQNDRDALIRDLSSGLGVQSEYFQINARAQVGHAELALSSLIYASGTGIQIFTISRSIGTDGL